MSNAKNSETVLTDDQIHNLWIMRKDLHGGDLMAQLEDFARAVLEAAQPATAVNDGLRGAVNALLHQIEIGDFVDSNGHSAKMLKPVHDLMRLLSEPAAPAVPDDVLRALLKHNEELFAAYRARTAVPAVPAVREPLTDEQVSYLEQQAFASTNHTIERPIYQHWFRKGVRAGYGITGDSNG